MYADNSPSIPIETTKNCVFYLATTEKINCITWRKQYIFLHPPIQQVIDN